MLYIGCSAYYQNTDPIWRLEQSCAMHGMQIHPFGVSQPWRGTVGGDTWAHFHDWPEVVRNAPPEYDLFMHTDSADVFAVSGEEEIITKFYKDTNGDGLLVAAETGLYPPSLHDVYNARFPNSLQDLGLWRYQNAGGFIGTRDAMIRTMDWMWTHYTESGEAMYRWLHCLCDPAAPKITLDTKCSIFQAMSGEGSSSLDWESGRPYNRVTGEYPVFPHWNGRLGGIEEGWRKVYG